MIKTILLVVGAILALTSCASYEGVRVVEKLHEFTGSWSGSGKTYASPDDSGTPWTAAASYQGAYDDVLIEGRENLRIAGSETVATLSFMGWDWETNNPVLMSVGNDGLGARKEPFEVIGENTYQITRRYENELSQPVVDVQVTQLLGQTYKVTNSRSVNNEPAYVSFEGTFQRTAGFEASIVDVEPLAPLSNDTKRINCMQGTYHQKGHFMGAPLDGDETIDLILGGHAMFINFNFDEDAGDGYLGSSMTSWSSEKGLFTGFMLANDGMTATFHAWLSEDRSQLIYEPMNSKGEGLSDERWHADLNQESDHCLLNVMVGKDESDTNGLFIKFTPVGN